jgi:hypothetical protein
VTRFGRRVGGPVAAEPAGGGVHVAVEPLQQADLLGRQRRVPDVDDENDAILAGVVPRLVLEVIVEHQALAFGPLPGLIADAKRAVAGRDRDPEMAPQPQVGGPAMGGDMCPGAHP